MIIRVSVDYTHPDDHNLPTYEIPYRMKHSWHHDFRKDSLLFIGLYENKVLPVSPYSRKMVVENAATPALQMTGRLGQYTYVEVDHYNAYLLN